MGVPEHVAFGAPDRLAIWLAVPMVLLLGGGFALGGFIPPPGPGESAAEIAAFYREDVDVRRIGVVMLIVGGTLFIPFGAAVASRLSRIRGIGPTAAFTELAAATVAGCLMMTFGTLLLVALLRPDMPDDTYLLLNHLTFLAWVGLWQPGALQAAATAVAVLSDRSPDPVLPAWVGWFSAWMAFGSLMGSLMPFVTSGPFAWNGFIGFFIAACPFFAWFVVMFVQLLRAGARTRVAT